MGPQAAPRAAPEYEGVDAAIRQALADPTQRMTVLKCEELVEKFLADPCQEALQFPTNFTSYQRMLAHRVGQYYGLQTSTVDYEESQGRVLGIRTQFCEEPKPKLRTLDIRSDPMAQRPGIVNGTGAHVADKPRLLRRQDDGNAAAGGSDPSLNMSPARSMKERHENYQKAREELGLSSHDGMGRGGGRGGPGGRFGMGPGGRMDGGRGRKAVFRDKEKDLSDPDYRRGMNRFNGAARFDPAYSAMPGGGIYQVPTYSTEFPSLGRMPSSGSSGSGRPHMASGPQHAGPHSVPHVGGMGMGGMPAPQQMSMAGQGAHQGQSASGSWGQQQQSAQQGQGGMRPPPPPPPPHHHQAPGPGGGASSSSSGGPGGRGHHQGGGGGMGSRQQQQQHQSQQQQAQQQQAQQQQAAVAAAYGASMSGAYSGMAGQYQAMPVAGFMQAAPGQHVFGVAAGGGALPAGAMYATPAHGMGGAFYPGMGAMGMGMSAVGMAVPAAGAYGYVTAPAPGVGMGSQGEAIALSPQGAYPVYASYPATAMYPATAAQMAQATAMHPGGGAAIPMRPMYGMPAAAFYPQYDPSQYGTSPGVQAAAQGHSEGRGYGGGHHGGSPHSHHTYHGNSGHSGHYGSGSGNAGPHGRGGGRDSDVGLGRGESHGPGAGGSGGAAGGGAADK
ncbi:hypothetical protein GPECTOR_3g23 [Gonium pectorale]|uniref:R3H domain-containing protein n=1 Tax=Gonium pectorale TaxID=33097 RepID=A0A150GZ99_GONPE|nr:hypothetical protein GPECTOR_3g23 [Gonium pectorale]|eukprot:KXZ55073.1 hypothetical protein GPECTOR_3g23 [Gonium pectorale]